MGSTDRRGLAIGLAIVLGSLLGLTIATTQTPQPAQADYGPAGVWNTHCQARASAWDSTSGSNVIAYNRAKLTNHMLPSGHRYCTHFHTQVKVVTTGFKS